MPENSLLVGTSPAGFTALDTIAMNLLKNHALLTELALQRGSFAVNVLPYSEDFEAGDPGWGPDGSTLSAAAAPAPGGLVNATKLVEDDQDSEHLVESPEFTVTPGAQVVASIHV